MGRCLHYIPSSALGKHLEEQPSHPRGDVGMAAPPASPQTFPCSAVPASSTASNGKGTRDRGQGHFGVGFGQAVCMFQSVGWEDRKGCPWLWLLEVAQRLQGRKERMKTSPQNHQGCWGETGTAASPQAPAPHGSPAQGRGSLVVSAQGREVLERPELKSLPPATNTFPKRVCARKIHISTRCSSART